MVRVSPCQLGCDRPGLVCSPDCDHQHLAPENSPFKYQRYIFAFHLLYLYLFTVTVFWGERGADTQTLQVHSQFPSLKSVKPPCAVLYVLLDIGSLCAMKSQILDISLFYDACKCQFGSIWVWVDTSQTLILDTDLQNSLSWMVNKT